VVTLPAAGAVVSETAAEPAVAHTHNLPTPTTGLEISTLLVPTAGAAAAPGQESVIDGTVVPGTGAKPVCPSHQRRMNSPNVVELLLIDAPANLLLEPLPTSTGVVLAAVTNTKGVELYIG
jgi:hypothetical protein